MLIILIVGAVTLLLLCALLRCRASYRKAGWGLEKMKLEDIYCFFKVAEAISASILLILFFVVACSKLYYHTDAIRFRERQDELVALLDSGDYTDEFNITDKDTYAKIRDYNTDVKTARYWRTNPWTSWFFNDACMEVHVFQYPEPASE